MSDDTFTQEAYSAYVEACRELSHEPKTLAEWSGAVSAKNKRRPVNIFAPVKWAFNHFNEFWAFVIAVIGLAVLLFVPAWHLHPWWVTVGSLLFYGTASICVMELGAAIHRSRRNVWHEDGLWMMFFIVGALVSMIPFAVMTARRAQLADVQSYFEDTSCLLHHLDLPNGRIEFFDNTEDGFHTMGIGEYPTRSGGKSFRVWGEPGAATNIEDALAELCK